MPTPLYATGFEGFDDLEMVQSDGWLVNRWYTPRLNTDVRYVHGGTGIPGGEAGKPGGMKSLYITDYAGIQMPNTTGRWVNFWFLNERNSSGLLFHIRFYSVGINWIQFQVRFESSGLVTLRNAAGTVVATSVSTVDYTQGHWVSVKMKVAESIDGGECEVKIDGVSFVSYSGDTQNTSSTVFDNWDFVLFGYDLSINCYIDDVIITDETDGEITETYAVLGRVVGAGDSTNWTPESGNNWENVSNPADVSTYVEATASSTDDLYTIKVNRWIDSVSFVRVVSNVATDLDGTVSPLLKSGGTTAAGTAKPGATTDGAAPENFGICDAYWDTDPSTSSPFTEEGIRNLQIGIRTG